MRDFDDLGLPKVVIADKLCAMEKVLGIGGLFFRAKDRKAPTRVSNARNK
jgi:hypothetical protein